jgi:hypothetical protein
MVISKKNFIDFMTQTTNVTKYVMLPFVISVSKNVTIRTVVPFHMADDMAK